MRFIDNEKNIFKNEPVLSFLLSRKKYLILTSTSADGDYLIENSKTKQLLNGPWGEIASLGF